MSNIKKLALWKSILFFGIPSLYFFAITNVGIPYLTKNQSLHPALSWFIAGYLVFVPLFIAAVYSIKHEEKHADLLTLLNRLRIKKLSKQDWYWTVSSAALILITTGIIMIGSKIFSLRFGFHELQTTPQFMKFNTLQGYEKLYLLLWLPMFFFNVVGEEMFWRGYILPRQELTHGNKAWLVNAVLWMVFHICFGIDLMIVLLPTLLIIPYIAQKSKNILIGMITHAALNGPMFMLIALGIIG